MGTVREIDLERGRWFAWTPMAWAVVLLVGVAVYGSSVYERLPDVIAIHWGPDGRPDEWALKSFSNVYLQLLIAAGACLILAVCAALVPAMTPDRPEQSVWEKWRKERDRRVVIIVLSTAALMTVALISVASVQMWQQVSRFSAWPVVACILAAVMIAVPLCRSVASDMRRMASAAGVRPSAEEESEDARWIAGGILKDPDDPQVLVPKREGTGYGLTVNIGHWQGRTIIGAFFVVTLVLPLALLLLTRD